MTGGHRNAVLAVVVSVLVSSAVAAQPVCLPSERLISWPNVNPIWQLCAVRPQLSSGPNGSGLEIHDVYYNGHMVLKRAHAPILNVLYNSGGCGCYRDWSDQETRFLADNVIASGYAEPTVPPLTVCDNGGAAGDIGTFYGIAAEKLANKLILTTQFQAGWYRYAMKWYFHADGRIQPIFGFAAVSASCVAYDHTHHNYWRLDFEIDGAGADWVEKGPPPESGPPPSGSRPYKILETEAKSFYASDSTWMVMDYDSGRGYRIVPSKESLTPPETFGVADYWFLRYKPAEIDDTGQSGPACAIKFTNYLNNESLDGQDIVAWYRGGAFHRAGDLDDCHIVGPMLQPVGDWSP